MSRLGAPRLHLRRTDSTNLRARSLASLGAPHGTLVTATEQLAARGRQGRSWSSPPGTSLSLSVVVRDPPSLLSLAAGVAVADTVDAVLATTASSRATIKWPNDVLLAGRKVAGILVEGRPHERWAVLGIGLNVALRAADLPEELRDRAGTLGLPASAVEPTLARLLVELERVLDASPEQVVAAVGSRDALHGKRVQWADGALSGMAAGIDACGRLLVHSDATDQQIELDAGEVHLSCS